MFVITLILVLGVFELILVLIKERNDKSVCKYCRDRHGWTGIYAPCDIYGCVYPPGSKKKLPKLKVLKMMAASDVDGLLDVLEREKDECVIRTIQQWLVENVEEVVK